jgi:hypothetical protein
MNIVETRNLRKRAVLYSLKRNFFELKTINEEHQLIVTLTPSFESIFQDFAVVDSEEFPWLCTDDAPQEPDLFVCLISFYTKRPPPRSEKRYYPEDY